MSQAHAVAQAEHFLTAFEMRDSKVDASASGSAQDSSGHSPVVPRAGLDVSLGARLCRQPKAYVEGLGWETGLASGAMLGIPWYDRGDRLATLMIASSSWGGTLEVWHFDAEVGQLCLSSGYFGAWHEFRRISALTRFAAGLGLPGRVWEQRRPVLFEDLTESSAFLRADAARTIGLEFGLGLPVIYEDGLGVVVLLSTRSIPIARSIDIWRMRSSTKLERIQSFSPHSRPGNDHNLKGAAEALAFESAQRFAPLTMGHEHMQGSSKANGRLPIGFAWPARDTSGDVYVATLIS